MKLFWTGTDSLMLIDVSRRKLRKKVIWLLFRYLIRILDKFYIEEHYCDSENIADNLKKFGICKKVSVKKDDLKHIEKYSKIPHEGFNVIYYKPPHNNDKKFWDWIYGYDVFIEVKKRLPHINFIELDGKKDMIEIYPITDFYLRPNNHDGASRMRQECEIQNIPYYWTNKNPDVESAIKKIKNEFNNKQKAKLQQK